jgi:hypothetical protein
MDEDDDEDDIVFNAEGGHSRAVNVKDNPDAEFEGEFGFALLKALRGNTVGRRLKRNLFKFGCFQLICNFALFMITIQACKTGLHQLWIQQSELTDSLLMLISFRAELPRHGILRYTEIWGPVAGKIRSLLEASWLTSC